MNWKSRTHGSPKQLGKRFKTGIGGGKPYVPADMKVYSVDTTMSTVSVPTQPKLSQQQKQIIVYLDERSEDEVNRRVLTKGIAEEDDLNIWVRRDAIKEIMTDEELDPKAKSMLSTILMSSPSKKVTVKHSHSVSIERSLSRLEERGLIKRMGKTKGMLYDLYRKNDKFGSYADSVSLTEMGKKTAKKIRDLKD